MIKPNINANFTVTNAYSVAINFNNVELGRYNCGQSKFSNNIRIYLKQKTLNSF